MVDEQDQENAAPSTEGETSHSLTLNEIKLFP